MMIELSLCHILGMHPSVRHCGGWRRKKTRLIRLTSYPPYTVCGVHGTGYGARYLVIVFLCILLVL
jgi:hypothetical protein